MEKVCKIIRDFAECHIDEIKESWRFLGFEDAQDMLKQIENDPEIAVWALTELFAWGLEKDWYREEFLISETEDETIVKIGDRYFRVQSGPKLEEVEKKTEIIEVEVTRWVKKV